MVRQRHQMMKHIREKIKLKVDLRDSYLTKEQKLKAYDLIEECQNAFSFFDEVGTCLQVGVHLQLCDEEPFLFTHTQ